MSERTVASLSPLLDEEWPDRLRRGVHSALRRCQIDEKQWRQTELDVHHIVAAGLNGALPARQMLSRWSINVHTVVNAAIVPRSFHRGQGLHRQEFLHIVNLQLSSAALFAEAILPHGGFAAGRLIMLQTIQKIGYELVARSEDQVAIRLQAALQALVARSAGVGGGGVRSDVGARAAMRGGRQRFHAASGGARVGSAVVSPACRPGLQYASAGQ